MTSVSDPSTAYEPSKDLAWYQSDIDKKITPEIRQLLETYSKVPPGEVRQHVYDIREKAWAIRPYPCTGLGNFLTPMITKTPIYSTILSRLQKGDTMLDIGCFLGQDLRRLFFDGAPTENMYGIDIVNHWDLGFEMFRDSGKFKAHFIESDILKPNEEILPLLKGKVDVISVTHVLHQWRWDNQVLALKQFCLLSRLGCMVVGFQVGNTDAKETGGECSWFMHNVESMGRMWEQVERETGTEWVCDGVLKTWEELGFDKEETAYLGEDARLIQFVVRRTG